MTAELGSELGGIRVRGTLGGRSVRSRERAEGSRTQGVVTGLYYVSVVQLADPCVGTGASGARRPELSYDACTTARRPTMSDPKRARSSTATRTGASDQIR